MALVVDTGPLLAAGDPDDRDHARCQALLDSTHEPTNAEDYALIRVLLRQYADFPLGVDASVVAVCERLGERKVATLDHRHFSVIRPSHARSLRLLPDA